MNIKTVKIPGHMNVSEFMYRNARKYPNKAALVYRDQSWTFSELNRLSNKVANGLIAMGIKKGDHICMMQNNSEKFLMTYFGILKAGGVVVPMNTRFVKEEIVHVINDSDSRWLFYSAELTDVTEEVQTMSPNLEKMICVGDAAPDWALSYHQFDNASEERPDVWIEEEDDCCILYSSGTTGRPNGSIYTHRAVCYNGCFAGAVNHRLGFFSKNVIMMPLFHSAPLHNHMLGTYSVGGTVVLLDTFDCDLLLKTIEKEKCTHFFGPATVYLKCVKELDVQGGYDLSSMEMFVMGGSPCAEEDMKDVIDKMQLKGRLMQVYGLTESGPFGSALFPEHMDDKPGSIGLNGSLGAEMVIVDEEGNQITEPGVVGEIAVFAESHMREYYKNKEKTQKTLVNGWIMSGDLAKYDEDGFVYFVDRVKDMIISGGQNIYSKEVEDVLMRYPGIAEVAVIGIPHREWGESVKAVVSMVKGVQATPEEIKAFTTDKLARYKRPRYIDIIEALPHNASGKILKKDIKMMYSEAKDSSIFG